MIPIFYIKEGELNFGQQNIFNNLELYLYPGDRVCLVGRNGCGKSSLMKVINKEYELDKGEIFYNKNVTISYLKQDNIFKDNITIEEYTKYYLIENCLQNKVIQDSLSLSSIEFKQYLQGISLEKIAEIDFSYQEMINKINMIFSNLDIDKSLFLANISGGQLRRVFLAFSLIKAADILLLDEPTNHLDIDAILWLEGYLKSYEGAIVIISHDKWFQRNVTNKVWWLDRGELRKSNKGFKFYDEWRDEIIEEEEVKLRKMNRKLEAEKSWLNTGVTARRKRNQRRLHMLYKLRDNLKTHENKLNNAQAKLAIKLEHEAKKSRFIIEAKNISYGYSNKPNNDLFNDISNLFNNFSFKIQRGEKIGIIGPNGCGKSTLLRLLMKEIPIKEGFIRHADNLELTYFDQNRSSLQEEDTVKYSLCGSSGSDNIYIQGRYMHVCAYLKKFMFDPKMVDHKISTLSGGQKSRLLLAKMLINPGNLMILDEPTNDLDCDSLEILLDILSDYDGTLIVVSHDRDFIERLVTRILVFKDKKINDLFGGYNDYLKLKESQKENILTKKQCNNNEIFCKVIHNKKNSNIPQISDNKNNNKLSYKYKRLLQVLPQEIDILEKEIKDIENSLSKKDLFTNDPALFNKLTISLEKSKLTLDEKMELWLEIEDMK
ncbi:MAG TPA: ABC-F family ATP-binding cassette domain-containing protein [Candidatus Megaira endosymbiont of Hartmannula sinica]|nr:ABC-F family ATP-binding cassette domain-containing protein [Candidatus Megaera endosymbiont of Hartmannula sinica]